MLTNEQITAVKVRGFLLNRSTECFSGRVVPVGGIYSADDLAAIAECAKRFGNGTIAFTSRLCAEIVGIPYEQIDAATGFLAERGLAFGGTGAKVRPLTACKGTTCVFGNIDTQKLVATLHHRFYVELGTVKLPHKFKIGVGGCPNSCMKPSLNDVGIEGHRPFAFDESLCRGCGKCIVEQKCPSRAVSRKDGKAYIDPQKCLSCGVCVGKCPFGAVPKTAEPTCRIYVGGTWGKTRREGTALSQMFTVEQVPGVVEKIFLWFKACGLPKERLARTIERVGFAALEQAIASDALLERRDEILNADAPNA